MRKISLILFLIFFITYQAAGQNKKIDSLIAVVAIAKEDTNKIKSLLLLAGMVRNKPDQSLTYLHQGLDLAKKLNDKNREGKAYQNLSTLYSDKGNLSKSLEYFNLALTTFKESGNDEGIAIAHMNMGVTYGKDRKSVV